ncbi:SIR2 family NAD-dependent protein deacylase [Ferrovum myxofaciens]|uniref:SIR2 family NAD-dependent protein deacylase n=1 Tax=Ferrovum myxofaciens TaxID=416213 RepID=UPI003EC10FB7
MHELSDLSDYPAIKKLASALHQFDGNQHGAAIMIGAGFSRSAARHVGGEKKMPLWYEFSKKLATELNPNGDDLSFSDPLRVAEEYRAYFGQAALNARIRDEIDDDAWRTGDMYLSLLKLPWSEIMTTNWDTLLERAAKDVHGPYYTTVTKPSDFTWAPSPRIVKLHGTIGTTDTFIAAQEDYRTYPEKFAPFVNFARQVFIENELCLLGFSGDDPNFLHWAGWVRDHLAGHAGKIYLVGALKLTAARRKYLESINIAPIDLWDAVKHVDDRDLRHLMATGLFLKAMMDEGNSKVEPHTWTPSNLGSQQVTHDDLIRQRKEPEYAATLLKQELETLQNDRESYPGWLVCPPTLRWRVQNQLSNPYPNAENIAALAPDDRAKLLYEIAWRHSITFEYISSWLAEALFQVCNPDEPCGLNKRQQMEIVLVLLKNSCWLVADDEVGKQVIQERVKVLVAMLEKHAQYLPDCAAEIAYHQVLTARDELNYVGMEALVEKIAGEDPVWKLRQAALLMELGRFDEGKMLIANAYGELRENHRRDRYSIPILSRLVWAHWLLIAAHRSESNQIPEELPAFVESNYQKWKCDPWDWIEKIQEEASKQQKEYLQNKNPIEPSFEQGHYRDNSRQRSFSNEISELLQLDGLARSVGIPLRSGGVIMNVNPLAGSVDKLVLSGGTGVELWDYTLAIRAASDENSPSIKGAFTRIGVACASKEVVDTLVDRILLAIGYWREKRNKGTSDQQGYVLSALRVLIEVLARLVVRESPDKAGKIFRLAISLGQQQDLQHYWLFDVFDHLLTHSQKSIPESEQGKLLADALAFPLQSEMAVNRDFPRFPNPVINHPDERETYPGIERRVGELIEAVTPGGSVSSTAALLRLLPLVEKEGFLTQIERGNLASVLWGSAPTYQVFPNTGLLPHALLLLPTLDAGQVKALVCRHLYEHGEEVLTDTQEKLQSYLSPKIHRAIVIYKGMANAAANETTRLLPTQDQALALFDRLVVWRPQIEQDVFFGAIADSYRKQLIQSISNALSYAIAPVLSNEAKTAERFEQLKAFYEEIEGAFFVIPALVYFSHINEYIATDVKNIIRNALQGRDATEVSYAAIALQKWMGLFEAESSLQLSSLISRLIAIIESGRTVGLQQLLLVAGELFKNKQLSEEQVITLIDAIQNAFNAANYINIEPNGQEAISVSGIREACAKLANTLVSQHPNDLALLGLLKESKTDALPEVRFAIDRN